MNIAIAGNIGSGKTTLTNLIAKQLGFEPHYEDLTQNPYISDFYADMQRWSFNLQVYFLNHRINQLLTLRKSGHNVIQDRTIYEDAEIFAPNLLEMGLMSQRDYETYQSLYQTVKGLIEPPTLVIYLKASISTLVEQIQSRGREYEDSIRLDYLKRLNNRYDKWYADYNLGKKIEVLVDGRNFIENREDLGMIIQAINAELYGLFR
ncbi:MAG: deoxynucleoside kinase [Bacteroidia bacterium]|nr:deoxynucleoside kinase [Bacteroidia bacterium]